VAVVVLVVELPEPVVLPDQDQEGVVLLEKVVMQMVVMEAMVELMLQSELVVAQQELGHMV
jgi:hypothetical protein